MPSDSPPLLLSRIRSLFARREANLRESVEALLTEQEAPSVEQEGEQAEALGPHERALLRNVLKLRGATAYDVMLPRADIIALQVDMDFAQVLDFVQREGHSRYPVYGRELDDIQGMVHIKDVIARLGRSEGFSLRAILRKPLLVVPSVPVLDLLLRMRMERVHLALVVDEYGGIDGIVTIEDLVETIVGDISDEHDELASPQIIERAEGVLELDARTPVEDFEMRLGPVLTEEERASDIDTVGGLVFTLAGRVPAKGEIVSHLSSGLEFRVLDADARRIRRLRVRKTPIKAAAE